LPEGNRPFSSKSLRYGVFRLAVNSGGLGPRTYQSIPAGTHWTEQIGLAATAALPQVGPYARAARRGRAGTAPQGTLDGSNFGKGWFAKVSRARLADEGISVIESNFQAAAADGTKARFLTRSSRWGLPHQAFPTRNSSAPWGGRSQPMKGSLVKPANWQETRPRRDKTPSQTDRPGPQSKCKKLPLRISPTRVRRSSQRGCPRKRIRPLVDSVSAAPRRFGLSPARRNPESPVARFPRKAGRRCAIGPGRPDRGGPKSGGLFDRFSSNCKAGSADPPKGQIQIIFGATRAAPGGNQAEICWPIGRATDCPPCIRTLSQRGIHPRAGARKSVFDLFWRKHPGPAGVCPFSTPIWKMLVRCLAARRYYSISGSSAVRGEPLGVCSGHGSAGRPRGPASSGRGRSYKRASCPRNYSLRPSRPPGARNGPHGDGFARPRAGFPGCPTIPSRARIIMVRAPERGSGRPFRGLSLQGSGGRASRPRGRKKLWAGEMLFLRPGPPIPDQGFFLYAD